jgi:hypothetical protein
MHSRLSTFVDARFRQATCGLIFSNKYASLQSGVRVSDLQYEFAPRASEWTGSGVSAASMSQLEIDDVGYGEKSGK